MSNPFIPSTLQANFFDWVRNGKGSCVLIAVAGSGKSTTIVRSLPETKGSVLILSFNTVITVEMSEKVRELYPTLLHDYKTNPSGRTSVRTFHSLGFGAVCKFLNKKANQINTDGGKLRRLFQRMHNESTFEMYAAFVTKLVSLAKGEGIGALKAADLNTWHELIAHHDLYLDSMEASEEEAIELARGLLRESNKVAKEESWIDFDDQLYLPLLWKLRLFQHDWVFIDEAQDTNPVRRAIAKLALRYGGRLVAVGDPGQAIYGFTGASHDAIDLIKSQFAASEMPLTVSYRCPQSVGQLAAQLVPHFQVHENAPKGEVLTLNLKDALARLENTDVILCRNVKPLVELAFKLIAQGRGCTVLGKEIGEGLVSLVRKMRAKNINGLQEKLEVYRDREVAKFTAKGEEGKAEGVSDRVACLVTVIASLDEKTRTINGLISKIEGLFTEGSNVLTLSTCHKSKGREWKRVAILQPELMPSKWARQDWQQKQEQNLIYVTYTRAKEELIFLATEGE